MLLSVLRETANQNEGSDPRMMEGEKGCLLLDSCFSYSPHLDQIDRRIDNKLSSVSVACGVKPVRTMPVVRGLLNDKEVKVLRDSGCSTSVARRDLIRKTQFTNQERACILIDGTVKQFPVAKVYVDTPYYTGELEVLTMENPFYDLILGNVPNVRNPSQPKSDWKPAKEKGLAAETIHQRPQAEKPLRQLEVAGLCDDVSVEQIRQEQETDPTLNGLRRKVASGEERVSRVGNKTKLIMKDNIMYRRFSTKEPEKTTLQLIVPKKFRRRILSHAHRSFPGGHLGAKKTTERVSADYYWPGVHVDTRRYCRACEECHRSLPKDNVPDVPVGATPPVDEPSHTSPLKRNRRHDDHQKTDEEIDIEDDVEKPTTPLDKAATTVVIVDDEIEDDWSDEPNPDLPRMMMEQLHSLTLKETQTYRDVVSITEPKKHQKDELRHLLEKYSATLTNFPGVRKADCYDIGYVNSRRTIRETVKKKTSHKT